METSKVSRRGFVQAIGIGAASMLWKSSGLFAQAGGQPKYNVLFIAVDDLRPQLGCYGQDRIQSPNIDQLAKEGLLFERTYCQQAVCAPSRVSIMSGTRPDTTKIYNLTTPLRQAMPDVLTLPQHFKKNGYDTFSIGKIYHHTKDDLRGWSKVPYRSQGDWKGRGYLTEKAQNEMKQLARRQKVTNGRGPAYEAADVADNEYPDGKNTDYAIDVINRFQDKPFFLAMGFYKPHLPFNAPKKYWDLYPAQKTKLAENPFTPKNVPSYALTNWGELRNYYGIPKKGPCSEKLSRELIRGYNACVSYIDAQIGRLLKELDRLKLREKTVVILWGDHGWKLGEHGMWCKHTNFELDTHVPMILSVPGMKTKGRRTKALTEYVDMYPTLCEACGLKVPQHLEGLSVMPLLKNPDRLWKKAAFSQYPRGKIMGYSIRTERFRYTEWQDRKTGKAMARELYDHENDSAENTNLAKQPEYADQIKRLSEIVKNGWKGALPT
jgi:iduronate 2-sulfatase